MGRLNSKLIIARTLGNEPAAIVPALLNGLARFEVRMMLNGQKIENVFYAYKANEWASGQLAAQADLTYIAWVARMLPLMSDEVSMLEINCTDLSNGGGDQYLYPGDPNDVGSNTSGDSAPFLALKVRLQTDRAGRSGMGWKRVAGLVSSQFILGRLTAGALSDWQDAWDNFLVDSLPVGTQWVVASFVLNGAPRTTPIASPIVSFIVKAEVTTQNSRKFGRGT